MRGDKTETNTVLAAAIQTTLMAGKDMEGCLRAGCGLKTLLETLLSNEAKLARNLHKTRRQL